MGTVRDIISGALRLIGALSQGEAPDASSAADGLSALNAMVKSWSTEGLIVPFRTREVFTLVGGTASYTMGPAGDFVTARAIKIENASVVTVQNLEIPIKIIRDRDQWDRISIKDQQSELPQYLYIDGTSPADTLNFWPVPTSALSVVLYSEKALSNFTSLSQIVELPDGYERAYRFNLAVEIAPEYSTQPAASVVQTAVESKANIKRINMRPHYMQSDAPMSGGKRFNLITGD